MKTNNCLTRHILLVMILLLPAITQARKSTYNQLEHHDFIYLAPSLGYYSLMDKTESNVFPPQQTKGGAAQLGVGYRMYHNHFLFATGVNAAYDLSFLIGNDLTVSLPDVVDITAHFDLMHTIELQVPVMVGAEVRRFYFLIGPKIGFNTCSYVKPYAVPMTKNGPMPIVQNTDATAFRYSYNLNAAFEMGWRLGEVFYGHGADIPQPSTRYYFGVFAEGGALCRIAPEGRTAFYESTLVDVNGQVQNAIGLYPMYALDDFKNTKFIHNYTVGVKFSILFEIKSNPYCVLCKDHKKVDFTW